MLTHHQIQSLYDQYLEIVLLEVSTFGCKPTEVRHLLGRLGEFYCALKINGTLAHVVNQHGFDVVSQDNKKVSVKTTAQKTGFVTINPKTLDKVDELMLLQFINHNFEILYHGSIQKAVEVSRMWAGKYEFDISKARKLTQSLDQSQPQST